MIPRSLLFVPILCVGLAPAGCDGNEDGPNLEGLGDGSGGTPSDADATALPGDAPGGDGATMDVPADVTQPPADTGPSGTGAIPGYGTSCTGPSTCAPYGLGCVILDPATAKGTCGTSCANKEPCPTGTACNPVGATLLCTDPQYCDPCTVESDCSKAAPICALDTQKKGFCSTHCTFGGTDCRPGSTCDKFGEGLNDTACFPDFGTCKGTGKACDPCKTNWDCATGTICFQPTPTSERFCAQTCVPGDPSSCPQGYGCVTNPSGGLCFKLVAGKPTPTCTAGSKGYCDPCTKDLDCASGKCISKNNEKFCALASTCTKATEITDCPYGGDATFCVPVESGGLSCVPPLASGCQGFKSCKDHPCAGNETCDHGLCVPKG